MQSPGSGSRGVRWSRAELAPELGRARRFSGGCGTPGAKKIRRGLYDYEKKESPFEGTNYTQMTRRWNETWDIYEA